MTQSVRSIKRIVCAIIGEVLGRDPQQIDESSVLRDLGAGELDLAEILTYVERRLHIVFPDHDEGTRKTHTVGRLTKRILACHRKTHGRLRC